MTQATLMANDSAVASVLYRQKVLYVALELAEREWKLAFGDGTSRRVVVIAGRDCGRLLEEVEKAKERFRMVPDARVLSCYEAGREGFWLHRWLRSVGIENEVVDSASIERSALPRVGGARGAERGAGAERGGGGWEASASLRGAAEARAPGASGAPGGIVGRAGAEGEGGAEVLGALGAGAAVGRR